MLDDDEVLLWIGGPLVVLAVLPGVIANFVPKAAAWMVEKHLLTTTDVIVPIGVGAGLDACRLVIIGGVLLLSIVLIGAGVKTRKATKKQQKKNGAH